MREMMIEKLPEAIVTLSDNENELIQQIYFNHISDNELSRYSDREKYYERFEKYVLSNIAAEKTSGFHRYDF